LEDREGEYEIYRDIQSEYMKCFTINLSLWMV